MANTPYPFTQTAASYGDRWECPSLYVSKNGIDWFNISYLGGPDPLVDLTADEITRKDYFSDPCLVYVNGTLEVWFRQTNGLTTATDIYKIKSTDGVTWTVREKVLEYGNPSNGLNSDESMRTPQIFYQNYKYIAYFSMQGGRGLK